MFSCLRVIDPCTCLFLVLVFFFFKQKTAYEMRIRDWSSDVCSSDLMSLIEHARDSAALPPDRSETVVPIGLASGTISDHGKHPVESREALAFGDHLFKLWSDYVPDVCPYFSGWPP